MRHLTDERLDRLLHELQDANQPDGLSTDMQWMRETLQMEYAARHPGLPEDWRTQASEFIAERGVYKLVPGIAGGRLLPPVKRKDSGLKIESVDMLLMLVGEIDLPEDNDDGE